MRVLIATALVLALGCSRTQVFVSILRGDVDVPEDVDQLTLEVTNPSDDPSGMNPIYATPLLSLCGDPPTASGCSELPVTTVLFPGKRSDDLVRIGVRAYHQGEIVTSDAASFTFTSGVREDLDFVLYKIVCK